MKNLGSQSDPKDVGSVGLEVTGASVGDLLKVAAVDAQGRPTAWAKAVAGTDYQKPVASTSVSSGGLISYIDANSNTLFTVQLPLYDGSVTVNE